MCTLMLRHWRAWVRTTCGGSIRRAEGTNNLWGSIQRAEGENNLWSSIRRAEGKNNLWGLIQRAWVRTTCEV